MLSDKEQNSDVTRFLSFLRSHLKRFILIFAGGALLGYALTFLIPKQYRSFGVVFPPSSTAIESSIDFPNFGYDVEADRLIQILESREIRDSVVKHFDLANYYEVDFEDPAWHDRLVKEYERDIRLERLVSMAVVISARTKDPELSAKIVAYIIERADDFREKIYKSNIVPAYRQARAEYDLQQSRVDSAEAVLVSSLKEKKLNSLLLLMSDAQLTINLDKIAATETAGSEKIGGEIIRFKSLYQVAQEAKNRMVKIKKTLDNPIPKLFIVHPPEPLFKKVSPSFFVNALAAGVLAVIVGIVLLTILPGRENANTK